MSQRENQLAGNAATAVIWPIAGLVGGLFVGGLRSWGRASDPFNQIAVVVKWGVTGFFAGLAIVVLLAFPFPGKNKVTIWQAMMFVVVAGVLIWFFARILSGIIGYEGF